MIFTCDSAEWAPTALSGELERSHIVYFPKSPVAFPSKADLDFLREEAPAHLHRKNISYHPESDRVAGLRGGPAILERARRILQEHCGRVKEFLARALPTLARGWKVGTSSFRPLQERGRNISRRASSELVHVDAGAYGATHGARILRFFMNAHPTRDRVWISKGSFSELYRRHAREARMAPADGQGHDLREGLLDRTRTGFVSWLARAGLPMAVLADSSPYDRLMRRFHNWMKESRDFQADPQGIQEISFAPGSAWMVFADGLSHACISGQHAFIDTFIIPLENCGLPDLAPYHVLRGAVPEKACASV